MAQVIKIKRSTGTSAPGTLAQGELAYSKGRDTFYVGDPAAASNRCTGASLKVRTTSLSLLGKRFPVRT